MVYQIYQTHTKQILHELVKLKILAQDPTQQNKMNNNV